MSDTPRLSCVTDPERFAAMAERMFGDNVRAERTEKR